MSAGRKNESNNEHHRQAAELHKLAAHAHFSAAESHGKQNHLTGNERSRQALEYSQKANRLTWQQSGAELKQKAIDLLRHQEVAALAHRRWQARGCPMGSPDEDWQHAERELREREANTALRTVLEAGIASA